MRLLISYRLLRETLPLEYRRGFASLIKEAIKAAHPMLFERYYYAPHVLKPFTFSVYFPGLKGLKDGSFEVGAKAVLHFSTTSQEFIIAIYNGTHRLQSYPLFDNVAQLERIFLERMVLIRERSAIFKTMAPVLVNNKGKADQYLLPCDPGFEEGLEFTVKECARTFLGISDAVIRFIPIDIKRKVVSHYNQSMQGFVGMFELAGDPVILNLIYSIGLGVRRSQGFGMLELVRQGTLSEQATLGDPHE